MADAKVARRDNDDAITHNRLRMCDDVIAPGKIIGRDEVVSSWRCKAYA
jgi:hypothetical protein